MKRNPVLAIVFILFTLPICGQISPTHLTCEYLTDPQVIDIAKPRLSWVNTYPQAIRGEFQTAWEVRVAGKKEMLPAGNADLWNSGKVLSGESVNIPYGGKELSTGQECWWQVRVWNSKGKVSEWSEPAFWCMGILDSSGWKAKWIGAPWQDEAPLPRPRAPKRVARADEKITAPDKYISTPAPMLRKSVELKKDIAAARAFVTGLGYFEFYVNGRKAGNDVLSPNLTLYGKREDIGEIGIMTGNNFAEYRVMYLSYDIRDLLVKGENAIGVILGNGFYNPNSYWCQGYGSPRFLGQIHITYTDGSREIILSDTTWKASKSPILTDLIYDGEHYDARLGQQGWCSPGFNDREWVNCVDRRAPEGKLKAHMSPTDKVMERFNPVSTERLGDGHFRVDFGQEISGWLRIQNITGEPGRRIEIRYICESAMGDNSYTMKGGEPESYAARFTWFVFREVEIFNWPGELKPGQLVAEAVYTDIETTGHFECSNELFNKINKIWWRSQTDNMHGGVASDCPHRERSPYTGDGQVACVTVMHNFDARAFYTKWIQDIMGARNPENGYVPNGAPWQPGCGGGVGWGAAINIMPWEFYLHYGDKEMLKNTYEGMKGYIKYMLTWVDKEGIMFSQAPEKSKVNRWINLGDWVAPGKLPPDDMVHTFFLWRCSDLTAKTAEVLGYVNDAREYRMIAEKTKSAFRKRFFDENKGSYGPAGGNIFALKMGLPDDQKNLVIDALEKDIRAAGDHLDTGIFGTQFFFEVLSENGLHELAYKVMNQTTKPSYGWWLDQGATTTWEQWDGSNSRNHPMFGGGITWFYRKLAGMNADEENPGYKHIIFRPQPVKEISFVTYTNRTPYGDASINWKRSGDNFHLEVKVPAGCTAEVHVPCPENGEVMESGKRIKGNRDIRFNKREEGYSVYNIGPGIFNFDSNWTPE